MTRAMSRYSMRRIKDLGAGFMAEALSVMGPLSTSLSPAARSLSFAPMMHRSEPKADT
jgi:hypothetical protein